MKVFVCSALVAKIGSFGDVKFASSTTIKKASSQEEALGSFHLDLQKTNPSKEGWQIHGINASEIDRSIFDEEPSK